jgi:hypothetical protein
MLLDRSHPCNSLSAASDFPKPEAHAHLAIHRGRGGEMFLGLQSVAGAAVELAEPEVK